MRLLADDRAPRTRYSARTILILLGATLALVAVPAGARAAVRTGSVQDPQGDASALSGPALDIKSVAASYDDVLGTLRVTWSYYNDVRTFEGSAGYTGGNYWSPVSSGTDAVNVGWSYGSSYRAYLSLGGTSGTLSTTPAVSQDGYVVTVEFTNAGLAGHDWRRNVSGVSSGDTFPEFWFDGYSDPNPPVYFPPAGDPTTAPGSGGGAPASQGMTINDGAQYTNDPDVTLSVIAPSGVGSLRVANDGGFRAAKTFPVRNTIRWHLAESGLERLPKTVYLRFGNDAQTFTDDIILDQTKPTVSSATVNTSGAARAAVAHAAASKSRTYRVRINAKDRTSGVAKVQFAERGKRHPSALRRFARISRYTSTRAPKYVRVQDRAGNYSRWQSVR